MDIILGKVDSFLSGFLSLNILLLTIVFYYFVTMKKEINNLKKRELCRSDLKLIENLKIQNHRFVYASLLSMLICFFIIIIEWFNFYGNISHDNLLDRNYFLFKVVILFAISFSNSILSALIYLSNKISCFRLLSLVTHQNDKSDKTDE